jgi:bifunctional UDP-N-acetylglucosamine pyrophosphorylase / glucosamine-1-phosphate N-acetyltransferase
MGAEVPKPLVELCGKPILEYVLSSVEASGVDDKPAVVVGYQPDVMKKFVGDRAEIVMQDEQRGTGHAVMVAEDQLKGVDVVLVSYGDHALYHPNVYKEIVEKHEATDAKITMLTTVLPDYDDWHTVYTHFGRILRDSDGSVEAIREYKMCSDEEKEVLEVNNGMYCFDAKWLWANIGKLSDENRKKEFLLTDMIAIAMEQDHEIQTTTCPPEQGIGVNTLQEVALAEEVLCGKGSGA